MLTSYSFQVHEQRRTPSRISPVSGAPAVAVLGSLHPLWGGKAKMLRRKEVWKIQLHTCNTTTQAPYGYIQIINYYIQLDIVKTCNTYRFHTEHRMSRLAVDILVRRGGEEAVPACCGGRKRPDPDFLASCNGQQSICTWKWQHGMHCWFHLGYEGPNFRMWVVCRLHVAYVGFLEFSFRLTYIVSSKHIACM